MKSLSGFKIIWPLLADTSVFNTYLKHDSLDTFKSIKKVNSSGLHKINSYGVIQFGESFKFKSQNQSTVAPERLTPEKMTHSAKFLEIIKQ